MSTPFPLSPGQAVAVAAVLDAHPRRLPHWRGWADDLRTWAAENSRDDVAADGERTEASIQAPVDVVDLVGALRTSVEAAKARRAAGESR